MTPKSIIFVLILDFYSKVCYISGSSINPLRDGYSLIHSNSCCSSLISINKKGYMRDFHTSGQNRNRSMRGGRPQRFGNNRGKFNRYNKSTPKVTDYSKYINKAVTEAEEAPYVPEHTFADFGFNDRLVDTLKHRRLSAPTPIQDQSIPLSMQGLDVIGLANTGTGKTAAFLLPIIHKIASDNTPASVLILTPTRELAQQIDGKFRHFASGQHRRSVLLVGGMNIAKQISELRYGPQVIIGTPGRVMDLIQRRVLRLQQVQTFVLDEADRMCDMGFVRDIRAIEQELPKDRQTLCFSATMTDEVSKIVKEFMNEPATVSLAKNSTGKHIDQDIVKVSDRGEKLDKLTELLSDEEFEKVIIFGETKFGVQRLADKLTSMDIPSAAIHGNKSQSQRTRALDSFKKGRAKVLVATDVAARGIDVAGVSHVINYDLPKEYSDYIHRIGRTGRAGRSGKALTFIVE